MNGKTPMSMKVHLLTCCFAASNNFQSFQIMPNLIYVDMNVCVYIYIYMFSSVETSDVFQYIYDAYYNVVIIFYLAVKLICDPHCFNLMSAKNILMKYTWHLNAALCFSTGKDIYDRLESVRDLGRHFFLWASENPSTYLKGLSCLILVWLIRRTPSFLSGAGMWG